MEPQNTPPQQPNQQSGSGNDQDNIFVTQPTPPPTPKEKRRTTLLVSIGLIIGLAALVAGIFLIFFAMANSAASNYRSQASAHIGTVAERVAEIDVDSILSLRDVTGDIEDVEQLVRERPRLGSVILGETTSASYRSAEELAGQVDAHFEAVLSYVQSLPHLLSFAQVVEGQQNELEILREERPPDTPGDARTLAGSIDSLAETIETADAPDALVTPRNDLADAYRRLAEGYRDMAEAFEEPALSQAQAERRIDAAQREIDQLSSMDFTELVQQQRTQLLEAGERLQSRL